MSPAGPTCPSPRRCLAASPSCVPSLRQITESPPALIPTERGLNGSPGPPLVPRLPISAQRQRGPTGRPVARGRRTQHTAPLPPGTATAATPPRGLGTGGHRRGAGGHKCGCLQNGGKRGGRDSAVPPEPLQAPLLVLRAPFTDEMLGFVPSKRAANEDISALRASRGAWGCCFP